MADPSTSSHALTPQPSIAGSDFPMLYYGLLVIGTAAVVLALYNLIIIRWCSNVTDQRFRDRTRNGPRPISSRNFHNLDLDSFLYSFKYKKNGTKGDEDNDHECVVCLSGFEEGEELRQLPKCRHSFHAPCIDMWLYSHMDCPLCRSSVEPPARQRCTVNEQSEHSRGGLLGLEALV